MRVAEIRIVEKIPDAHKGAYLKTHVEIECGKMLNNCYQEVTCGDGCGAGEFCDSTGHCVNSL